MAEARRSNGNIQMQNSLFAFSPQGEVPAAAPDGMGASGMQTLCVHLNDQTKGAKVPEGVVGGV